MTARRAISPSVAIFTFGPVVAADGGLGVRARCVTRILVGLGLDVRVISVGEAGRDAPGTASSVLGADLINLDGGHVWRWMLQLWRTSRSLRDVDVVVVESALILPAVALFRKTPIVWDTTELETLHYRRLGWHRETIAKRLIWRVLESWAGRRSDVVVAVSEREASEWRKIFPSFARKVVVVDHVPDGRPEPGSPFLDAVRLATSRANDRYVLFLGNLGAKHNLTAARWCVQELAPLLPAACNLVLAGVGTEKLVIDAGQPRQVLGLGFVENIDELVAEAEICLAPLLSGAGVKTKVLHYVALGRPVIGTATAFEGIEDAPGCRTAGLESFAEVVVDQLSSPPDEKGHARREALQRAWVSARFDERRLTAQWLAVLDRVDFLPADVASDSDSDADIFMTQFSSNE